MNRNRNINDTIVDNLNRIIKEKRLTTSEVALAMNVSPMTIKRLLSREIEDFKISHLWDFCIYNNISFNQLILGNSGFNNQSIINSFQSYQEFIQNDDSMERAIRQGDCLMINTNIHDFKSSVYLIKDYNGLKIRRLSKDKYGNLIVKADNEKYETVIYTEEEQKEYLEIKGIVMYRITNFF